MFTLSHDHVEKFFEVYSDAKNLIETSEKALDEYDSIVYMVSQLVDGKLNGDKKNYLSPLHYNLEEMTELEIEKEFDSFTILAFQVQQAFRMLEENKIHCYIDGVEIEVECIEDSELFKSAIKKKMVLVRYFKAAVDELKSKVNKWY